MTAPEQRPTPALPPIRETLLLTERERDLILQLRRIDFFRVSKERSAIVAWNGVRLRVFDGVQIT